MLFRFSYSVLLTDSSCPSLHIVAQHLGKVAIYFWAAVIDFHYNEGQG